MSKPQRGSRQVGALVVGAGRSPASPAALEIPSRPSNVDEKESLKAVAGFLTELGRKLGVAFPAHRRTRGKLASFVLLSRVESKDAIRLMPPLGQLENLSLMTRTAVVVTDSGGIEDERPSPVGIGTNTLVGRDFGAAQVLVDEVPLAGRCEKRSTILRWDGQTARRMCHANSGFVAERA